MNIKHYFLFEAIKITLFCLLSTSLFAWLGASQATILMMFNIAVMSAAATFSPEKKHLVHLGEGALVVTLSILLGGMLGFYCPLAAPWVAIVYASLAFWLPRTKFQANIFITGALMFFIFTSFPFGMHQAGHYSLYAVMLLAVFLVVSWLLDRHFYREHASQPSALNTQGRILALNCFIALSVALGIMTYLKHTTALQHLYWVGLTVLVVLQSASQGAVKTALLRIGVNIAGAVAVVTLMTYFMPTLFWVNLLFLTALLFSIFAFGYSYVARTLFIEMFVLSFTHLLGRYHNVVSIDRIVLTLIGGVVVIAVVLAMSKWVRVPS